MKSYSDEGAERTRGKNGPAGVKRIKEHGKGDFRAKSSIGKEGTTKNEKKNWNSN
jgi:hypothetical protein